jgi:alpha-L-fucosidase
MVAGRPLRYVHPLGPVRDPRGPVAEPAEWVRTAKEAGIKYIVITSKHHDGFCLFDAKSTNYNVAQASPYAKDLLKPLAEECRKQGLKFCVYYSVMDWHHPAQDRANDKQYNPTKIRAGRQREYLDYMRAQLKELLQTCDPEVLWFDGEWPAWYREEDGLEIYNYLRGLKPRLIVNNRVGKGRAGMEGLSQGDREYVGDFGTPEQQIPATGLPGVDWESRMTMNDTWGFKSDDHNWKSPETLIRNLIDIASKGGNYLLMLWPIRPHVGRIPRTPCFAGPNGFHGRCQRPVSPALRAVISGPKRTDSSDKTVAI